MKSETEIAQLCPTLRDPMDCSLPGSSVRGIFQARVLEWVAIAFSIGGPWASPKTSVSSRVSAAKLSISRVDGALRSLLGEGCLLQE